MEAIMNLNNMEWFCLAFQLGFGWILGRMLGELLFKTIMRLLRETDSIADRMAERRMRPAPEDKKRTVIRGFARSE